jgi:hypothetical protein
MRAMMLRRLLVWSVLAVMLAALALAMAIVWTANEREWYVDSAGVSATLDMTLSDAGRWIATAVIGGLMALVLLAFAVELATANAARGTLGAGPVLPSLEARAPARSSARDPAPAHVVDDQPTEQLTPPRFASTIVGDETTRRMERSLPPSSAPDDEAEAGGRTTVRLRPAGRR